MRANVYDTRILVRGDLLLPDLPAVVVAARLRDEDLEDAVAAAVVDNDLSPGAHGGGQGPLAGVLLGERSLAPRPWLWGCVGCDVSAAPLWV